MHSLLYLDTLHCARQHDYPPDADTPYLLLFAARPEAAECDVMRITSEAWQNALRSGDTEHPRTWVHHHITPDTLVLVALLEQHWRHDMQEHALETLRDAMHKRWQRIRHRAHSAGNLNLSTHHAFSSEIRDTLRNDTLVEVCALPIATPPARLAPLDFAGRRARYQLQFSLREI